MKSTFRTENPKAFISYSWTTPKHEEWVLELAKRLVSDGVDVVIDKWNLKEGHDKYHFMEQMVRADEIKRVLIILDQGYKEKADSRAGGVGTETQIISPEMYEKVSQEKFIPIVSEKDEDGEPYIPTFLRGRIYIDLSENEKFDIEYEKLLRNIYERPSMRKPQLGEPPSFLFDEEQDTTKLKLIKKQIKRAFESNKEYIHHEIRKFSDELIATLEQHRLSYKHNDEEFDRIFMDALTDILPLRTEVIDLFESFCYHNIADISMITELFEKLLVFNDPPENVTSYTEIDCDNYRFFIKELFLYLVVIFVKNQKYKELGDFYFNDFMFYVRHDSVLKSRKFDVFYFYIRSLEDLHKKFTNSNLLSVTSDFLLKRTHERYKAAELVEADLLSYYMSKIVEDSKWFPASYVYGGRCKFEILRRLKSRRHFEKVKVLYRVTTTKELQDLFRSMKYEDRGYPMSFGTIPHITEFIDIDQIGTLT